MSGATGAGETQAFAWLLRELKDRSGLSYGVLAKRLHMSTSTLHRYCNGTAVPVDYAPVERLARVCRATSQELVELHRHWILADATRGRGADQALVTGSARGAGRTGAAAVAGGAADRADAPGTAGRVEPGPAAPHGWTEGGNGEPVVVDMPGGRAPARRRRRTALIASVAVAAVLAAVAFALHPPFGGDGKDKKGDQRAGGVTAASTGMAGAGNPSASAPGHKPSASAAGTERARPDASKSGGGKGAAKPASGTATGGVPLTVRTRSYVYDNPCSQHFLVDSEPGYVGPPANEENAPRWAASYGAVSSDAQRIALTVQGTSQDTVVLEALHVRILAKDAPLAWNDYSMGVGCGGGVDSKSFDINLDNGSPTVTVKNGQRNFPYKVSESDPEVFYVTAHTTAHDFRWDLTLDWSSGSRSGTVHIDDKGSPFRTSADADRPGYDYPVGGGEWIKREN